MHIKSTDLFRRVLDAGDVSADILSNMLVEKLSKHLDRDDLKLVVNETAQLVRDRNSQLVDSLQRAEAAAEKEAKKKKNFKPKRNSVT